MTTIIEDAELIVAGVDVLYSDEAEVRADTDGQECLIINGGQIVPVFEVEACPHPVLGHVLNLGPADFAAIGRMLETWDNGGYRRERK